MTLEKNAKNVRGADGDVFSLLAVVPLDPFTAIAGYQAINDRSTLNQNVKQLNLGLKYALSKRTELYTLYSMQKADNGGRAGM